MRYFDCANNEISKENFLFLYKNLYCYKNATFEEETVRNLLANGINSLDDLKSVLSWKIENRYIRYIDCNIAKIGRSEVDLRNVYDIVSTYEGRELFDRLVSIRGFGTTYAATLLFFKSNMYYPIYDKFAQVALSAIVNDENLSIKQTYIYRSNPENFWQQYMLYISDLESVFGDVFRYDRIIDQALWAYGHLFDIRER